VGCRSLGGVGRVGGVAVGAASLAMLVAAAFRSTQIMSVYVFYIL